MQSDGMNTTSDKNNSNGFNDRRKRINRMKMVIIIIVIILMIIPMIFCILLGLQVNRLQKQVEQLISIHSQYDLASNEKDGSSYAYAAVKEDTDVTPTVAPEGNTDSQNTADAFATDNAATDTVPAEDSNTEKDEANSDTGGKTDAKDNPELSKEQPEEAKDKSDEKSNKTDQEAKASEDKEIDSLSQGKYADKKIYLTFDDGPSIYTDDILDILKKYNVKATFFVVGKTDDYSKKMYQRIVEEGHTLGMHSYSHKYSTIYNSVEDFEKDFTKLWKLLYDTTGYKPSIFRFPGGSDNMVNKHGMDDFIRYLNDNGIVYFDWNVLNGDATGVKYTKEQLIDNVLNGVDWWDNSIVLMHDSQDKRTTVDSLSGLLKVLKSEGAQILPIDKDVTPVQMIKADTIK